MTTLIFALPNLTVDLVAQLVEHNTFNVGALGSSPSGITEIKPLRRLFSLWIQSFFCVDCRNIDRI